MGHSWVAGSGNRLLTATGLKFTALSPIGSVTQPWLPRYLAVRVTPLGSMTWTALLARSITGLRSLPPWQRLTSEAVHWLLYALVFAATVTGWLFASFRGWPVSFFHLTQLPMLASESASAGRTIEGWHQAAGWALLVVIAVHVLAAMAHIFIYRDRIMQRRLP